MEEKAVCLIDEMSEFLSITDEEAAGSSSGESFKES